MYCRDCQCPKSRHPPISAPFVYLTCVNHGDASYCSKQNTSKPPHIHLSQNPPPHGKFSEPRYSFSCFMDMVKVNISSERSLDVLKVSQQCNTEQLLLRYSFIVLFYQNGVMHNRNSINDKRQIVCFKMTLFVNRAPTNVVKWRSERKDQFEQYLQSSAIISSKVSEKSEFP